MLSHFYRDRKELDLSRQKRDEAAVSNVIRTIESIINPFDLELEVMVQLSTDTVEDEATSVDMEQAYAIGEAKLMSFLKERVLVDEPDIYSPMTIEKLKTFTSMSKGIASKNSSAAHCTLKNDRDLFARLLLIGKSRNIDTQELLSYAVKSAPLLFANINGSMVKTDKAKLMHAVEYPGDPLCGQSW